MIPIEVRSGDRIQIGEDLQILYRYRRGGAVISISTSTGSLRFVESMPGLTLVERLPPKQAEAKK